MQPSVFLDHDTAFFRVPLSQIVERAGFAVATADGHDLVESLARAAASVGLVILTVPSPAEQAYELLRRIRARPGLGELPILGVTALDRSRLDFEELRALGVVGLIDKSTTPEQIAFRVNQILRPPPVNLRRHARVPVFFPVDVEVADERLSQYAIDLSAGGMRITAEHALRPGTELRLAFQLEGEWIECAARVAHCQRVQSGAEGFQLGLFFSAIDERAQQLVVRTVSRHVLEPGAEFSLPA